MAKTKESWDFGRVARVGNLTRDAELSFTRGGCPVVNTRIAVDVPGEDGEDPSTAFYSVTLWSDLAEHAAQSLHKGDRVAVIGRGEVRTWIGPDGLERSDKIITADAIAPDLRFATAKITRIPRHASLAAFVDYDQDDTYQVPDYEDAF